MTCQQRIMITTEQFKHLLFCLFAFFRCTIDAVFIISNPPYDDAHIKPYKDRRQFDWIWAVSFMRHEPFCSIYFYRALLVCPQSIYVLGSRKIRACSSALQEHHIKSERAKFEQKKVVLDTAYRSVEVFAKASCGS